MDNIARPRAFYERFIRATTSKCVVCRESSPCLSHLLKFLGLSPNPAGFLLNSSRKAVSARFFLFFKHSCVNYHRTKGIKFNRHNTNYSAGSVNLFKFYHCKSLGGRRKFIVAFINTRGVLFKHLFTPKLCLFRSEIVEQTTFETI